MKSKGMICLRLVNMLLILGTTVGLLTLASSQMVWASYTGSNTSNSNQKSADGTVKVIEDRPTGLELHDRIELRIIPWVLEYD